MQSESGKGKVIVTGGAGFIGSHSVVALIEDGYAPIIVDDFSNSEPSVLDGLESICGRAVPCHRLDCGDPDALATVFEQEGPIRGVIHFAAFKAVAESVREPLKYYRNNVGSLITLLELMQRFEVQDLVFSSSCTVYGQPDQLPVTEETPIKSAESAYGETKQVCETVIRDLVSSGAPIRAAVLRYFNPIGAHASGLIGELPIGDPANLVPVIMQSSAGLRGPVQVFGGDCATPDGTCIRDYIHVVDLAEAHVRSLDWLAEQDGAAINETFNLGTGHGTSVREAIVAFEKATGRTLDYRVGDRREGDIEQIYANTDKASEVLGWRAGRGIVEAMGDAWRWQCSLAER
jgi:UDP-glucose 4-epimerase